jgi:hypothetical protein
VHVKLALVMLVPQCVGAAGRQIGHGHVDQPVAPAAEETDPVLADRQHEEVVGVRDVGDQGGDDEPFRDDRERRHVDVEVYLVSASG